MVADNRVVLVTGASSGIGKACAEHLFKQGYRVYGTSRNAQSSESNKAKDKTSDPHFEMIKMDVDDDLSVQKGIELIVQCEGRLDAVVNCAGVAIAGAVEDTTIEEAKSQLETNFYGTLRVCRAVLPSLRKQRHGYIVNISSVAGLIGIPFQAFYSANKFALEGMTEALRMESNLLG